MPEEAGSMHSVRFFDSVSIPVPRSRIYKRLGYRKGMTRLLPQQEDETNCYIEEAQSLMHFKGAVLRLSILKQDSSGINLPGDIRFESCQLSEFLDHCREIILMGATAGCDITDAIHEDTSGRNVTRGIVFDATASEMTDAVLSWIMEYYNRILRRENKSVLARRFSAGYSDFLLENQKTIYNLLQLNRIGIQITENCMLVPEKSVTAISGIVAPGFILDK